MLLLKKTLVFFVGSLICTMCIGQSHFVLNHLELDSTPTSDIQLDSIINTFMGLSPKVEYKKWEIASDNFWVSDIEDLYVGRGLFSDYSVKNNLAVLGLPVNIEGHLILQNSQINKRLSGFRFEFDKDRFNNQCREKIKKEDLRKNIKESGVSKEDLMKQAKNLEQYGKETVTIMVQNLMDSIKNVAKESIEKQISKSKTNLDSTLSSFNSPIWISKRDSLENNFRIQVNEKKHQGEEISNWLNEQKGLVKGYENPRQMLIFVNDVTVLLKGYLSKTDSTGNNIDTSISSQIERIKLFDERFEEEKQKFEKFEKKTNEQKLLWREIENPDKLERYAKSLPYFSKLQQIMLRVKSIQIGNFILYESSYSIASIPLNGFSTMWSRRNVNLSIAVGKEGKSPVSVNQFFRSSYRFGLERQVLHIKGGVGQKEESNIEVFFSKIESDISNDSTLNFYRKNQNNALLGTNGKYFLTKKFYLNGQGILSAVDGIGNDNTNGLIRKLGESSLKNAVCDVGIGYSLNNQTLEISFSHIGELYQTLGNPFLLTNRNDIRIKSKNSFFKRKISIITEVRLGTTPNSQISVNSQRNLFSVDLKYLINKKGDRIWSKYQPATFSQKVQEQTEFLIYNTATIGYQKNGKFGEKNHWTALIQMMNYRQETSIGDTAFVVGRKYSHFQYIVSSPKWASTFTSYGGWDKGVLREGQISMNHSITWSKIQVDFGVQTLKRPFYSGMIIGNTLGSSTKWKNSSQLGIKGTLFFNPQTGNNVGYYLSSFFRTRF
jgi:hypothetical protein